MAVDRALGDEQPGSDLLVAKPLRDQVSLPFDILASVAEALLMLWLLVFVVNVRRWAELVQER